MIPMRLIRLISSLLTAGISLDALVGQQPLLWRRGISQEIELSVAVAVAAVVAAVIIPVLLLLVEVVERVEVERNFITL